MVVCFRWIVSIMCTPNAFAHIAYGVPGMHSDSVSVSVLADRNFGIAVVIHCLRVVSCKPAGRFVRPRLPDHFQSRGANYLNGWR